MMSQEAFMQKVNEITAANTERSQQSANAMMKFQAEMSNTAHQREVEDLRAAGLNPMLSVNQGASTPNGAMAQVDMSGASALAQWNSASAALQGALANAGAIIRSAELNYQAQRDFPNTVAGLASRLIDDLGLRSALREIGGNSGQVLVDIGRAIAQYFGVKVQSRGGFGPHGQKSVHFYIEQMNNNPTIQANFKSWLYRWMMNYKKNYNFVAQFM